MNEPACAFLDADLTIVGATPGYLEATGTTLDQLVGLTIAEAFPETPASRSKAGGRTLKASLEYVQRNLVTDEMPPVRYDIQVPGEAWEVRFWKTINSPQLDADGKLLGVTIEIEDITDVILGDRERVRRRTYLFQNGFVALVAILFFLASLSFWIDPNAVGRSLGHVPPYDYYWNALYSLGSVLVLFGLITRRPSIEAAGHIIYVPGLSLATVIGAIVLGVNTSVLLTLIFAIASGMRAYGLIRGWQEAQDVG